MESVYSNTAFNVGSSAWKGALGVAISIGSELAMKYYGVAGAASFGQKLAQCLKNVGVQVGGGIAGGLAFMTARYAGMIALYCVIDVIEGDSSPGTPNAPPLWHGME